MGENRFGQDEQDVQGRTNPVNLVNRLKASAPRSRRADGQDNAEAEVVVAEGWTDGVNQAVGRPAFKFGIVKCAAADGFVHA